LQALDGECRKNWNQEGRQDSKFHWKSCDTYSRNGMSYPSIDDPIWTKCHDPANYCQAEEKYRNSRANEEHRSDPEAEHCYPEIVRGQKVLLWLEP
jgi:hypothetical protein